MRVSSFICKSAVLMSLFLIPVWGVEVCAVFSDHAVLQRQKPIPIWGWAKPNSEVILSLDQEKLSAKADATGAWQASFNSREASANPITLTIRGDGKEIVIKDLLVGDVWIAGGQSNMEWTFGQIKNRSDSAIYLPEIKEELPIRYFTGPNYFGPLPQRNRDAAWIRCDRSAVKNFTIVGLWFAIKVREKVSVPIGLIDTNWGGSRIEPWMAPESFQTEKNLSDIASRLSKWHIAFPDGKAAQEKHLKDSQKWYTECLEILQSGANMPLQPRSPVTVDFNSPTGMWNTLVYPVTPYSIKGVLWYQGESNSGDQFYFDKMRAWINGWRQAWNQPELPFYYVQLAAFEAAPLNKMEGDGWTMVREAQLRALEIPNTGMAVAIDLGEQKDIHPVNKHDVAERLSRWALNRTYGFKEILVSGPLAKEAKKEGEKVRVSFAYDEGGLMAGSKKGIDPVGFDQVGQLKWFGIAGADGVWRVANAVIEGKTVVISHPEVPEPVEVSYAWNAYPEGANLYNKGGLPASPFRLKVP